MQKVRSLFDSVSTVPYDTDNGHGHGSHVESLNELFPAGPWYRSKRHSLHTYFYIAVFHILLTQLDTSSSGQAHAYVDDLVHLEPSLAQQQKQANLASSGFCAFTDLEISLRKVEAIFINHKGILYDTPFLTLCASSGDYIAWSIGMTDTESDT